MWRLADSLSLENGAEILRGSKYLEFLGWSTKKERDTERIYLNIRSSVRHPALVPNKSSKQHLNE